MHNLYKSVLKGRYVKNYTNRRPATQLPELKSKKELNEKTFESGAKCIQYECVNANDEKFIRVEFLDNAGTIYAMQKLATYSPECIPEVIPARLIKSLSFANNEDGSKTIDYISEQIDCANDMCHYTGNKTVNVYYQHMPEKSLYEQIVQAAEKSNNIQKLKVA